MSGKPSGKPFTINNDKIIKLMMKMNENIKIYATEMDLSEVQGDYVQSINIFYINTIYM